MLMFLKEIYSNPTSFNIIWNNKDILVDRKSIYWKSWHEKGITYIYDLLDSLTSWISWNIMNIMKYNSIISAIVSARRKYPKYIGIVYNSIADINFESNFIQSIDQIPLSLESRSNTFYNTLIKSIIKEPTALAYWIENTNATPASFYESLSLIRASTKESMLIEFHYKILHNFLNVKSNLFKWKLINSPLCDLCTTDDTIIHHLFQCPSTKQWLNEMILFINIYSEIRINVSIVQFLLGSKNKAVNVIFLIMKYVIWSRKNFNKTFNPYVFK